MAFAVMMLAAGVLAAVALRTVMRARRRARRRVIEQPNSHYTSQLVRNGETRHRWQNIDLDRIHEINRGEVVRLLGKVDVSGVESLRETERVFLDQVANVAAMKPAPAPRDPGTPIGRDLSHRPA
ncbi:MAG: hypothetical protein ACRELT_00355 [Longimicrobiales bacterium]